MKENFKIDYRAQTARFFTTFPQPAESQRALDRNRNLLSDIAAQNARTISNQATSESRDKLLAGKVDTYV